MGSTRFIHRFFYKYRITMVLLILLIPVLVACGDENTAIPKPSATPATGTGTAVANSTARITAAGVTPTRTPLAIAPTPTVPPNLKNSDQVLNITAGEVLSLDPALASDVSTSFILRQIFSGLVTLDKDLKVIPDLAAAMPEVTNDGTVYTFTLRKGAKFHSGSEITADDLKFSWERATDPKLAAPASGNTLPAATYMNDIVGVKEKLEGKAQTIEGVTVVDRYTLQVKLDAPKPFFLAKLTYNTFYVVNKANLPTNPAKIDGSGPFKLAEFSKDQLLRLERFADFYNGPSKLNTVNIFLGADASNPQTQYEQGKLDYVYTSGKTVEQAQDPSNPLSKELVVKPQLEVTYVGFNNRHEPFDDPKVRQAFYMVIDRDKIVRAMFENKVVKANTLMPPGLPGYTGNPGPLQFDINRARDLLAQSTYHSPQNLPKITLYSTGSSMDKLLQDVYRQAFGIEIEVRQPDYKDFRTGLSSGQFQMYLTAWGADYPDPDNFLRALLGKGSTFNECGYNNPQFEELLKQADQQTDPQKRLEMYGKAEQIALTDAPLLPIYHSVGYLLVKPYVKGLELSSSGIISLKDVYIVK